MIKISCLGDIMCDSGIAATFGKYKIDNKFDFKPVFAPIKELISESDYVLANLETPISFRGEELTQQRWQFCSPYEFAEAVKELGVDYVSTANNHCLDRGIQGLKSTVSALDRLQFDHTGTYLDYKKRSNLIRKVGNTKLGILSYTYGTNAYTNNQYLTLKNLRMVDMIQEQERWIDRYSIVKKHVAKKPKGLIARADHWIECKLYPENQGKQWFEQTTIGLVRRWWIKKDIKRIKRKGADLVIVYLHVGGQYNSEPSELTRKTVNWLTKRGCNIIIANHEHVVHGSEYNLKRNQFSTFAIGNFMGSAGVLREPFDKKSEYSIVVHTYIDDAKYLIDKITFSITKTIANSNGALEIWPAYDLFLKTKDDKLKMECLDVAQVFSEKKYDSIYKEFVLCERKS